MDYPAMEPELDDDPDIAACKEKLKQFRLNELKDVLFELGLPKQGKKQELVEKITALLYDQHDQVSQSYGLGKKPVAENEVLKIVEETFRKMHDPVNALSVSGSQIEPGHGVKPKKKPDDSTQLAVMVRCPCRNSMATGSMIKCDNPQCNVWQHVDCVIIPKEPGDSVPPELPSSFYCDMCRISRADPFWVTINHPLLPAAITPSIAALDGLYTIEKTFQLSRLHRDMILKDEYDIQVWCILLNDRVPFRMHWPLYSGMQVNGIRVNVVNRQATQQLGANGRDDGPVITDYLKEGPNKIVLTSSDSRAFCFGVRIAKKRSLEEVLNLVPKEQDGEKFDDALARVRRCVGGGTEEDKAGSDSDIEVVADSVSVNLRCPMTGSRIKVAGRFKPCLHMGCFDLEAFVELNQRSRKWQCPICLKNYSVDNMVIDPYFNRITSLIRSCRDDISEIDVKPDGSWRAKGGAELQDLIQWHLPDGTLCMSTDIRSESNIVVANHETKEGPLPKELGSRLKLGLRKNNNGKWEISPRGGVNSMPSYDNDQRRHPESGNGATLTSSTDHENTKDGSYNSEPGQFDQSTSNAYDLNSSPVGKEQGLIVLSDSDDENVKVLSPSAFLGDSGNLFPVPNPGETSGMLEEQPEGSSFESPFFLGDHFVDLGLSFWEYPSSTEDNPGTNGTDNLGEAQNCPADQLSLHEPVSSVNLGVAANLPENGYDSDLGVSLSLGCSDESLNNAKSDPQKRKNPGDELPALDASVLTNAVDDDGDDSAGDRSGSPSSSSQPPRSVRQRLIQNVETDSD
ncbi:E3 SUMO-protein ligase SIZ2 [Brachypodium distachyon]|nr:E3 SUMO-protein ligase SIZ2 [Brachypodium distachyon]|eukprot:XP_024310394.1 E3 SUMO-protein ligase SIZ2 [Brachypodium distachyon]